MATIYPFRAFHYDAAKAGTGWDQLVTQPYDKITPAMQERYLGLSPYNLVRLHKGRSEPDDNGENVYTRARKWLEDWTRAGILAQDPRPALYPYFQDYTAPQTSERRLRKSFIALGKIEDYAAGIVYRHEQTLTGPKLDRLELLRQTRAHFGQIFMLYTDPAGDVERALDEAISALALQTVEDEYGVRHRLWTLDDTAAVARIQSLMAGKKLIIADGHHRYETALAYRDQCRSASAKTDADAPHEKVVMTFVNTEAPGLTILPTHRVVANVSWFSFARFRDAAARFFDWITYPSGSGEDTAEKRRRFRHDLAARGAGRPAFGVAAAGEPALLLFLLKENADLAGWLPEVSPLQRQLDLVLLHRLLLDRCLGLDEESVRKEKNLSYLRDADEALGLVAGGQAQLAFLTNPIRVEQVRDVALAGEVLPQKSTDFYPKLLSGLTLYRLDLP